MNILSLLKTLQIDVTVFVQFAIFLIAYFPIKFLLFQPYFEAYKERIRRTQGNQQASEDFLQEANELKLQFEERTREVNAEFKKIYEEGRVEAIQEQESLLKQARAEAKTQVEAARKDITQQFDSAKAQIKTEVNGLGELIVSKMIQQK